jgi:hypothetical protein
MKSLSVGELTTDLEWSFRNKRRRADLAFYLDREHPILLIEIKDEDGLTKSNAAHLKDYVSFVHKTNGKNSKPEDRCHFLFLSRYIPREDDASQMQLAKSKKLPVRQLRHGQIHNILAGIGDRVARMLCEYLEDVGMTYRNDIDLKKKDRKSLHYMFNRLLGMSRKEGLGHMAGASTVEAIPRLMETFFGNLAVLGNWVHAHNSPIFGHRFRRHLNISHDYDIPTKALSDTMTTTEKIVAVKEKISVVGGTVYLYAEASLRCPKGMWATVDFGYWYTIEKRTEPACGLYAAFHWPGSDKLPLADTPGWDSDPFAKFPDETVAERLLRKCLQRAKQEALKVAPTPYKKIIRGFQVP